MTSPLPLHVKINGAAQTLAVQTLVQLLDAKSVSAGRAGIAVAVNGAVVPRARWPDHKLADGDCIEIIQARQGG